VAAFDTAFTPKALTPANTTEAALLIVGTDTAAQDVSLMVDVANIGTGAIAVRVGIKPSGGSTHWKVYDLSIAVGDAIASLGPYFLENADAIQVRTDTANDAVFSTTGVESS